MENKHIVIVGGGFAGVKCAKTLRSLLPADCKISLFSEENHMVFHPLLAEVAAARVQPKDMAAVLRELLKGVNCRTEEVIGFDLANNEIIYQTDDDREKKLVFDQLVLAAGNTSNLGVIPGMADHAFPLKTVGDALHLQSHVINQMERAEICEDNERKLHYLSFVVVGGGFSGVEMAGELNDLVKDSARYYQNFKASDVTVTLVHSHDSILPEVGPSLRKFAQDEMEKQGLKFKLKVHAKACTSKGIKLDNGEFLKAGTVVCTIGSRMLPFLEKLDVPKDKTGKISVQPDMQVEGLGNVWALGDCARVPNAADGKPSPTTAQFAERQGAQLAHNIARKMRNEATKPFSHVSQGMLCSIGGKKAVAEALGMRISGFTAWFFWRCVYLMKLPSFAQRARVATAWIFDFLFPPALTSLRTDQTRHVGKAHYGEGEFIFREGEHSTDFYAIEEGEIEVLGEGDDVLTVLGPGDFFGEDALNEGSVRKHSCRAKVDSEVLVLGREIFSEITNHLTPVREAIATALRKHSSLWSMKHKNLHDLARLPLADVLEPCEDRTLAPEDKVIDVIQKICDEHFEICFVADSDKKLQGIITRSDLMHALELSAVLSDAERLEVRIADIMHKKPLFGALNDKLFHCVASMREHSISRLPIVESKDNLTIKGYIRIENVMQTLAMQVKKQAEESSELASVNK